MRIALLLLLLPFCLSAFSQAEPSIKGDKASIRLGLNEKNYHVPKNKLAPQEVKMELNPLGISNRIANIRPQGKIPIEVVYPDGNTGEKIVVIVLDGGNLDNGKNMKVVPLDTQKRARFIFTTSSSNGMHRVMLKKDLDTKIIQLWVGAEPEVKTIGQ
jgi:hypothetical protein